MSRKAQLWRVRLRRTARFETSSKNTFQHRHSGGRGWPIENVFDSETGEVLAGNEPSEILAPFSPALRGRRAGDEGVRHSKVPGFLVNCGALKAPLPQPLSPKRGEGSQSGSGPLRTSLSDFQQANLALPVLKLPLARREISPRTILLTWPLLIDRYAPVRAPNRLTYDHESHGDTTR